MGQAESILKKLLEENFTEKTAEEPESAEPVDYLKLAEELEKMASDDEPVKKVASAEPDMTEIEKTAYRHVIAEALREAASKVRGGQQ